MLKSTKTYFFGGIILVSLAMIQVGCKKTQDTIAKVIVKDAESQSVIAGAKVIVFGQSTEGKQGKVVVGDTTTTNAAGEAIFNFTEKFKNGQAGVFVLNIDASKENAKGSGIIKVTEEETSIETVFIQE
ncbi:MAG: hypothetical protein KJ941_04675 [Bacteroidetes bacterium]|nr:hypothetical protein [Bacteroidota bacterium]